MENMNKCPGCSQHCDRNNLQCGKGEAIFSGQISPESQHSHGHHEGKCCKHHEGREHNPCGDNRHGHCEGKHRGHRRPEFPAGSLADLLAKCGRRLFHGGDESMFAALTGQEAETLKGLLAKILSA